MKAFSMVLFLIGAILCYFGIGDLVAMFRNGDLTGNLGTVGLVVNGGIFVVGMLFIAVAAVLRKLSDRAPNPPPSIQK